MKTKFKYSIGDEVMDKSSKIKKAKILSQHIDKENGKPYYKLSFVSNAGLFTNKLNNVRTYAAYEEKLSPINTQLNESGIDLYDVANDFYNSYKNDPSWESQVEEYVKEWDLDPESISRVKAMLHSEEYFDNGQLELNENKKYMKQSINEIKRMNKLAGLLTEEEDKATTEEPLADQEETTDNTTDEVETPDIPDEVGEFYVVNKPLSKDSTLDDVMFKATVFDLLNQIKGGLPVEDIRGLFYSKPKASKLAKSMLKEFEDQLEEVEGAMSEFRTHKGELDKHKENARTLINKIKNIGTEEAE